MGFKNVSLKHHEPTPMTDPGMVQIYGSFLKWGYQTTMVFFLLQMIILGCEMGVPPFKETLICFPNTIYLRYGTYTYIWLIPRVIKLIYLNCLVDPLVTIKITQVFFFSNEAESNGPNSSSFSSKSAPRSSSKPPRRSKVEETMKTIQ